MKYLHYSGKSVPERRMAVVSPPPAPPAGSSGRGAVAQRCVSVPWVPPVAPGSAQRDRDAAFKAWIENLAVSRAKGAVPRAVGGRTGARLQGK